MFLQYKGKFYTKTDFNRRKKLRNILNNMKCRCYNPDVIAFKYYGAKGVTICDEWLNDFEQFYFWSLENGYQENLTIDRIDVNGNYEPSNCRWVTSKKQANNRTSNIYVDCYGEKLTAAEAASKYNINVTRLRREAKKQNFEFDSFMKQLHKK